MTRWPFLAALCATVAGGYFAVAPFGELRDPCPAFAAEATTSQNALPLVGYLASSQLVDSFVTAFKQGLSEFGYVEGRSVTIEYRSADGEVDRLPALAADLVQRHSAVIVAPVGEPSALAAKAATDTIPIVYCRRRPRGYRPCPQSRTARRKRDRHISHRDWLDRQAPGTPAPAGTGRNHNCFARQSNQPVG